MGATVMAIALSLGIGAPAARADEAVTPTPPASAAAQNSALADAAADAAAKEAAQSATPTPTPSNDPTVTVTPTITSPGSDELITTASAVVSGTRDAANEIQVFPPNSTEPACVIAPSSSDAWRCASVPLVSGPQQSIRVVARNVISNATEAASVTVSALTPPTITSSSPSNGMVSGTGGYPDATVTVTANGGASCPVRADANGVWACFLTQSGGRPLTSGSYTVTASQSASFASSPSEPSAATRIAVDTTPPGPPAITVPHTGTRTVVASRITFSGTGEEGANVQIDTATANGSFRICEATVTHRRWSCTSAGLPVGSYVVSALQIDTVGNPSRATSISLAIVAATTTPNPPTQPPGTHAPGTQAPGDVTPPSQIPSSPGPSDTASPTPTPTPGAIAPNGGGFDGPNAEWLATTPYTSTSPPSITPDAFPGWLRALLLAVMALLLLALPARLLAGILTRSRARSRALNGTPARASIFGRNRPLVDQAPVAASPAGPRWLGGAAILVATAALITLSSPVADQPEYLRLLATVAMAVAVVNAVWALIGMLAATHLTGSAASVILAPRALVLVALAALLSRFAGLSPALLFGLVLGVAVTETATTVARGRLAATQLAGLSVIGLLAWMLTTVLPAITSPLAGFAADITNAVAIISIGSAAVSLVPVGKLAGRAIFAWSRPVWLGLSLVIGTVFFALLVPVDELWRAGGGGILIVGAGIAFAGVSLAAWLWMRYIEPAR